MTRNQAHEPVRGASHHDGEQESALGPADPRALAFAAEELRARTMSLEEAKPSISVRLIVTTLLTVFVLAALVLVFRHELRSLW